MSYSHATLFPVGRAYQRRQPESAVAESLKGGMQVAVGLGTNLEHGHSNHAPQTTAGGGGRGTITHKDAEDYVKTSAVNDNHCN